LSKQKKAKTQRAQGAIIPSAAPDRVELWLSKHGRWVLLGGWLMFLGLYLSLASDELGGVLGGDNARYLMLSRGLASGKGYTDYFFPGSPAHTQYPFLFPLLLSAFSASKSQVFYSHLLIQLIASLVPLLIAAAVRFSGVSRLKTLLIFFLVGSIPAWFSFLLNILTEPLFMFFMFAALAAIGWCKLKGFDLFWTIVISLCVLFSALVREVGLVVFGAVFLGMVLEPGLRKIRVARMPLWAVLTVVFVLGWGGWTVRNMVVGEGGFYFKQLLQKNPYLPEQGWMNAADAVERVKTNILIHVPNAGAFAFPKWLFTTELPALLVGLLFMSVIAVGLAARVRQKNYLVELLFVLLFGVSIIWYFHESRFSLPVLPLAVFYFIRGLESIEKFFIPRSNSVTVAIAALLVVWQLGLVSWLCAKYHEKQPYPDAAVTVGGFGPWTEPVLDASKYIEYWQFPTMLWNSTADWIVLQQIAAQYLPKDAVIACRKPTLAWYFADRKATWYKFGVSPEEQWKFFREKGITHVLVAPYTPELQDMLKQYPDNFHWIAVIQRSGQGLAKVDYPKQ
jgi:hypothetical protein